MFAKIVFQATAGLYTQFLNFLAENSIELFEITHTSFGFTAVCYGEDYFFIARNSKKFQTKIRILRKKGRYFYLRKLKKRKGLAVSCVIFLVLTYIFSNIIWVININTSDTVMKNVIAVQLFQQEIYPGVFYTKEKLENAIENIMLENDRLGYLTLNFYKGTLDCNIYPRTDRREYINGLGMNNITASKSGIITDIRVYDGFSQVILGQSVSAGDVLVSNIYTDRHGNIYTGQTRAYIEAVCEDKYTVYIPYYKRSEILTGEKHSKTYLYFLGKEFEITKQSKAEYTTSLKKEKLEYFSVLGFRFPLTVKTVTNYKTEEISIENDVNTALSYGKRQIENIIINDDKLIKEIHRDYEYNLLPDGIVIKCTVNGVYEIT